MRVSPGEHVIVNGNRVVLVRSSGRGFFTGRRSASEFLEDFYNEDAIRAATASEIAKFEKESKQAIAVSAKKREKEREQRQKEREQRQMELEHLALVSGAATEREETAAENGTACQ